MYEESKYLKSGPKNQISTKTCENEKKREIIGGRKQVNFVPTSGEKFCRFWSAGI